MPSRPHARRTSLRAAPTERLPPPVLDEIRQLLHVGFDGDFSDDDWEHTIGGWHVTVEHDAAIVGHASVVSRILEVGSQPFTVGYLEGVVTNPSCRGQGFGSLALTAACDHIRRHYEMGALGSDLFGFYGRFGWERWRGPTYVRRPSGTFRSPEEDGYVMVLRFGPSADVDLWAPISCDERSGDAW